MRTRQEQIDLILDHYEHPRHRGALVDADVVVKGHNPGCGDVVTVYVKVGDQGQVADMSFEGQGCTISQAAASLLAERVIGRSLAGVRGMDANGLVDELGPEIVVNRLQCATLALKALQAAEVKFRAGQAARSAAGAGEESFA